MSIPTTLKVNRKTVTPQPKYGYYFFAPYISMLGLFLFFGTLFMGLGWRYDNRLFWYVGIVTVIYGVVTTVLWAFARYVAPGNRIAVARNAVERLNLSGHERILDVGSGRGLYAIEAAKKLTSGTVSAIDLWAPLHEEGPSFHHKFSQPTGNTIANARGNAYLSGVGNKIEFINMDATRLSFPEEHFDIVICAFIMSHLWKYQDSAFLQIRKILKPGGRVLLIDNVRDLTYFLLSTPHMFALSYIRGRKAKRLTAKNWEKLFESAGFNAVNERGGKGIIMIEGIKRDVNTKCHENESNSQ